MLIQGTAALAPSSMGGVAGDALGLDNGAHTAGAY